MSTSYTIECRIPLTFREETIRLKSVATDDEARAEYKRINALTMKDREALRPYEINCWTPGNPIPRKVSLPPFENPAY